MMFRDRLTPSAAAAAALFLCLAIAGCGGPNPIDDQLNSLCDSAPAGNPAPGGARPAPPHVVVHLIRGLGNVYSQGLDALTDEMKAAGLDATVHSDTNWQNIAKDLVDQHNSEGDPPGIVLLGHSYGADDVIHIAQYLNDQGIPVRLLLLLDATNPPPIPANVDRCVHFYIPWPAGDVAPGVLPGHPVSPADGNSHTQIVNDSLGLEGTTPSTWCISHLGIDASKYVHNQAMNEIFNLAN